MNFPEHKNEGWLYGLAFLIALALRVIQLGAAPLNDSEAALALQALHLAQGENPSLAPQPLYILFTSLFFAVAQATNFMARVVPALVGSALVFAPYLFKNKIGSRPALILAFLFSFDPGLTALSRQSNATILAVTFLLFAYGMWINRRPIPTGIFLALALLSGPSIWSGLLTLLLASIFLRGMYPNPTTDQSPVSTQSVKSSNPPIRRAEPVEASNSPVSNPPTPNSSITNYQLPNTPNEARSILPSLLSTLLLIGTLFLTAPNGLSAALASIPAYLTGWTVQSSATISRTLFTFLAYEPLGISIAALSLIRGYRTNSKRIIRLSLWLGVALLLAVFYRNTNELAWAIIPLLALAALELSRALDMYREELVEVGAVVLVVLILAFIVYRNVFGTLQSSVTLPIFGVVQDPRAFVLYGSLTVLFLSLGLVAFGWSARTARLAITWASVILFGIYSVGAAWGASGLRNPGGVELWLPDPRPLQADLLRASVDQISELSVGDRSSQPVTIFGVSSPALEWLLRDNDVTTVSTLDPQAAPPIVITPVMNDLNLPSAYRGQDFIWRQTSPWELNQSSDWATWLIFRKLPLQNETVILWARDDLFPDARAGDQPQP